ncbi:MAG: M15 family metallopeptidase [Oscillospiraceae bacterium]
MAYHYKKKRYRIKPIPVMIALLILILLVLLIGNGIMNLRNKKIKDDVDLPSSTIVSSAPSSSPNSSAVASTPPSSDIASSEISSSDISVMTRPVGSKSDWNLILLNNENKIDSDLEIDKTKFDTQWVDSRAAQAYKDMCKSAEKKSITLYLRSGYRSITTQKRNYDNEVARFVSLGHSNEEAIRRTNQYYAIPGHSEHHTGLAFDIITPEYHNNVYTLSEEFAKTEAYKWLVANSANYGFVLRYPKEKQDTTRINFEPWHYRYVGVEHAKYMTKKNLCLEEYLKLFES